MCQCGLPGRRWHRQLLGRNERLDVEIIRPGFARLYDAVGRGGQHGNLSLGSLAAIVFDGGGGRGGFQRYIVEVLAGVMAAVNLVEKGRIKERQRLMEAEGKALTPQEMYNTERSVRYSFPDKPETNLCTS